MMNRGELDKGDDRLIYDREDLLARNIDFIQEITLTSHAQYRMDQRRVTDRMVKSVIDEFFDWYERKKRTRNLSQEDRKKLENLTRNEGVRFEGSSGLNVVFATPSPSRAEVITVYWPNRPDPDPPNRCSSLANRIARRAINSLYS
jgi:hypothetical protein